MVGRLSRHLHACFFEVFDGLLKESGSLIAASVVAFAISNAPLGDTQLELGLVLFVLFHGRNGLLLVFNSLLITHETGIS